MTLGFLTSTSRSGSIASIEPAARRRLDDRGVLEITAPTGPANLHERLSAGNGVDGVDGNGPF
jgi:hypothetical protein